LGAGHGSKGVLIDSNGKIVAGAAIDPIVVKSTAIGKNEFLKCVGKSIAD